MLLQPIQTTALQQELNNALAQAQDAVKDQIEEETAETTSPELEKTERKKLNYKDKIDDLIDEPCQGVACKFPFDFISELRGVFNELVTIPDMPDYHFTAGYGAMQIDYDFQLSKIEPYAEKIRLFVAWFLYIMTGIRIVQIVRGEGSTDD